MTRVAIYTRVSTEDQSDNGTSLTTQLRFCRQYCEQHGLNVVAEYEEAYSGYEVERPILNKLKDAARQGKFDAIVVYDIDRFARGVQTFYGILPPITHKVSTLYVVTGGKVIDLHSVGIEHIIGFWAGGHEREKIRERCMRGKRQAIEEENRVLMTGNRTYGYCSNGAKKPDAMINPATISDIPSLETEPDVVRWIFEQYAYHRIGTTDIAHTLNSYGIRRVTGKVWNNTIVNALLNNPMYKGHVIRYKYQKKPDSKKIITAPEAWVVFDRPDLAIVSEEVYEKAQQRLSMGRGKLASSGKAYMMRSRLKCIHGRAYAGAITKHAHRYYKLNGGIFRTKCSCKTCIRSETVDTIVWNWVTELLTDTERVLRAYNEVQAEQIAENTDLAQRVHDFDKAIQEAESELTYLVEEAREYKDNKRLREQYRELIRRQNDKLDALVTERSNLALSLENSIISDEQIVETVHYFQRLTIDYEALQAMPDEERQVLLDALDIQCVLELDHSALHIHWLGRCDPVVVKIGELQCL
ncbi:resolvase domain-containing protein [Oscillochloris trichoides DG-6]|uniref:Resolvase domain-containing protein n=1 Tax=Oscillochloris trichoides DG-6 TaxID=765420 RepID=E1IHC0_9CHLR|nr:recombinase family protein [Oscillochloris trichoides]EFO79595.1 resolvase domain-containing protein [Oscillochloris trichoides DG-6]